jgi:hypothetical protein
MRKYNIILILFLAFGFSACTEDFVEINTDPNAITPEEASARYFVTKAQYKLFASDRYTYWRANLIHADRYAGYFCFGNHGSWWSDGLGYTFNGGYTGAAWGMYGGYFGHINTFIKLTEPGGDFENELSYSVGLILKSLYYQQYTDVFGMIPYSEAGNPEILLPKFDSQKDIYKGMLADLTTAINTIGASTATGEGVEDLGENDLYFKGDLQQWKAFANSLRLRIAMRALGATGDDFADGEINKALSEGLMETGDGAILTKDNAISQWNSSSYGDIWHRFGGLGSKWKVGQVMINYLRDYDDPRLSIYAKPAPGGMVTVTRPDETENPEGYALFPARVAYILSVLDEAGAVYTLTDNDPDFIIEMEENTHFVGQPTRLGGEIKSLVRAELFSDPADYIISADADDDNLLPEIVMSTAEVYFLRAEASIKGFGSDDANAMHQEGIRASMTFFGVDAGAIDAYLAASDLAQLNGSDDENLEKIGVQRWIANYTEGFEGWAGVRKSGYPTQLAAGVENQDIFAFGDIDGAFPQRMQYGGGAYSLNEDSVNAANAAQGEDKQDTKLWWAK